MTDVTTPKRFSNSLGELASEKLEQIQNRFEAQLEALATKQGIWIDGTYLFAFGRKSAT